MVLVALLAFLVLTWLVWTKMADSPSANLRKLELDPFQDQPLLSTTQELPSNEPSLRGPEVAEPQLPSVSPTGSFAQLPGSSWTPADAAKHPDHPLCQHKPPIPHSASDSQVGPAADAARPLTRVGLPSASPSLRQLRSLSWEEQELLAEFSQAQVKRQVMTKFVLGSFEDNNSDDELMAGSFRTASRRRPSLASMASSSSVDLSVLSSLSESGSTLIMR